MDEFDEKNHWLIDLGDGSGHPSVNLVVLSFVHPLRLLEGTTDDQTLNGVPRGMTQAVVDYFKDQGIRVMLSIDGITYTEAWNQALAENASLLGQNAAAVAGRLGASIEIDYEENRNPNLEGLQTFIDAYRSIHEYDASGNDHAARLTIDLAAGDRVCGLQQIPSAPYGYRGLRADGHTQRRLNHPRDARLHVLGRRMRGHANGLHDAGL